MSDMLPMHYALQFNPRPRPLPVYAPAEPGNVRMLLKGDSIDVWPMREATVGEMKLSFCPVRHPVETFAVCVECDGARLVYTGDTNTDFALELFCDNADLLLADAGLPKEKHTESSPHLSAALCGKLARDTHSRRLLLTHLNPKFDASALLREARRSSPPPSSPSAAKAGTFNARAARIFPPPMDRTTAGGLFGLLSFGRLDRRPAPTAPYMGWRLPLPSLSC